MKFYKKLNKYKASNVEFDLNSNTAWSYDWYMFYGDIEGVKIFNNTSYSSTTNRHQFKVRNLIDESDIDLVLQFHRDNMNGRSLSNILTTELVGALHEVESINSEIKRGRNGSRAQQYRLQRLGQLNEHIEKLRSVINNESKD